MGSVASNPVRLGQNAMLASPSPSDLWLPVFGGEVLTWFEELNISQMLVRRKTIMSGSTTEFPLLHQIAAERHAVGTEMLGLDIEHGKRTISLDDRPLVSHFDIDDVDAMLAHFDDRQEIAREAGRALANEMDRFNFRLILNAARTAADGNSSFPGGGIDRNGTAITSSDFPSSATGDWDRAAIIALLDALEQATMEWAENDIPENDRGVVVPFKAWYRLRNLGMPRVDTEVPTANFMLSQGIGPSGGNIAGGVPRTKALDFNGLPIWGSNHLPNGENITTGESKYQGDFTKTRGLIVQNQAVGHLTLMDVMTETDRDVRRQTNFFVTKVHTGGGTLRPEAAIEIAIP
jgi:hypothetical protein